MRGHNVGQCTGTRCVPAAAVTCSPGTCHGQKGWLDPYCHIPHLGGSTIAPRMEHRCWPPPRSLRNHKGQRCEGTVPHCDLSPGRRGGQTPTMSQLLGVPPSPPRTEHHPWRLPRSPQDCSGVRGHSMGTVSCCDLSLGRRDDQTPTTVSLVFGGATMAPQDRASLLAPAEVTARPQGQVPVRTTWPPTTGHQPHEAPQD